jgi:type I restriction enzyme M protein
VVEDKWLAVLRARVEDEVVRVSQALTGRVRQLAERYHAAIPDLAQEVESLAESVDAHLVAMGFAW